MPPGTGVSHVSSVLTDADLRYIRANFQTLEEACAGRSETPKAVRDVICAGLLPRPTYVLDDGTEMVPPDYLSLVDAAGGVDALRGWFVDAYARAAESHGGLVRENEIAEEWEAYLSGEYGACLRTVTPETIIRKDRLMGSIERRLADPRPDDASWCEGLRSEVCELDALEREFAPYDRVRWGPVSRDRLVAAPRERFPAVFA
jgi:hypothetical protein